MFILRHNQKIIATLVFTLICLSTIYASVFGQACSSLTLVPTFTNNCTGSPVPVTITVQNGTPPFQISVDFGPSSPFPGNTTTINNLAPGIHTFVVNEINNLLQCGTVQVTISNNLSTDIILDTGFPCFGNPFTLSALTVGGVSPLTFLWSGPDGATSNTHIITIPNFQSSNNGIYTVTVTDSIGCVATSSVDITAQSPFIVDLTGPENVCPNGSIVFTTSVIGTGPFSYQWFGPQGSLLSTEPTLTINNANISDQGTYSVVVKNTAGCTVTAEQFVSVNFQAIPVSIRPAQSNVCQNSLIQLTAVVTPGNYTFAWEGPNGFTASTQTILVPATQPGIETFAVQVTDNITNCVGIATIQVMVQPSNGFSATISVTDACTGVNNGSIDISVIPGTGKPPFNLFINGSLVTTFTNFTTTLSNVTPNIYNLVLTDSTTPQSMCFGQPVIVHEVPLNITISGTTAPVCIGAPASLTASVFGLPPYNFIWRNSTGVISNSATVTIPTTTPFSDTYTVTVTDAKGCMGQASQLVTVSECVTLNLSKFTPTGTIPAVGVSAFTFVVSNTGTVPATNLTVTDILPNELAFILGAGPGWTVTNNGQTVTAQLDSLDVGQSTTFIIQTQNAAIPGQVITNTASIISNEAPIPQTTTFSAIAV